MAKDTSKDHISAQGTAAFITDLQTAQKSTGEAREAAIALALEIALRGEAKDDLAHGKPGDKNDGRVKFDVSGIHDKKIAGELQDKKRLNPFDREGFADAHDAVEKIGKHYGITKEEVLKVQQNYFQIQAKLASGDAGINGAVAKERGIAQADKDGPLKAFRDSNYADVGALNAALNIMHAQGAPEQAIYKAVVATLPEEGKHGKLPAHVSKEGLGVYIHAHEQAYQASKQAYDLRVQQEKAAHEQQLQNNKTRLEGVLSEIAQGIPDSAGKHAAVLKSLTNEKGELDRSKLPADTTSLSVVIKQGQKPSSYVLTDHMTTAQMAEAMRKDGEAQRTADAPKPAAAASASAPAAPSKAAAPKITFDKSKGGDAATAHMQMLLEENGFATDKGGADDHKVDGIRRNITNQAIKDAMKRLGVTDETKLIATLEARHNEQYEGAVGGEELGNLSSTLPVSAQKEKAGKAK